MLVYILPVLINLIIFILINDDTRNYHCYNQLPLTTCLNWIWNKYTRYHSYYNKKDNPLATEASTKYFLTQSTASILLIIAVIINLIFSGQWTVMKLFNPVASILIAMALTIKLGIAPFHVWVTEVTQGIPLSSGLILLTWQKLAPVSVLYQIFPSINLNIILTISILSVMVGGWGGAKPNPTTRNYGLLINRPHRLNNSSLTI